MTVLQAKSLEVKANRSRYGGFLDNRRINRGAERQRCGQWIHLLSQGHFPGCAQPCGGGKWAEPHRGVPSSRRNSNRRREACVAGDWHHHLLPKRSRHARIHKQPSATYPFAIHGTHAGTHASRNRVSEAGFARRGAGSVSRCSRDEWAGYKPPSFIMEDGNKVPPSPGFSGTVIKNCIKFGGNLRQWGQRKEAKHEKVGGLFWQHRERDINNPKSNIKHISHVLPQDLSQTVQTHGAGGELETSEQTLFTWSHLVLCSKEPFREQGQRRKTW